MSLVRALRRLWRHRLFRRLLAIRVAAQASDGLMQVALVSFVLFSPQRQPDAASIATVLAITLLPFSILGPFVSVVLDRWSRRQVLLVADVVRAAVVAVLAVLVAAGLSTGAFQVLVYALVLVAMSLNRFILAALAAALPHTIDADEYLVANSVVPTVGPAGAVVGAGIGAALRLGLGGSWPVEHVEGLMFTVAALGFCVSAALSLRIPRTALGPDDVEPARAAAVLGGLLAAVRHLRERSPAGLGLLTIFAQRIVYGVVFVAMILVYRNAFHPVADVNAALGDLALYGGFVAVGFVLGSVLSPPVAQRIGVRRLIIVSVVAAGVVQVVPGAVYARIPLLAAAFALGLVAQCLKICVDTLVQAHVDDEFKGRVFVLYDMIFNVASVVGAVITVVLLPADGKSVVALVCAGSAYVLVALVFAAVSARIGAAAFERGRAEVPA